MPGGDRAIMALAMGRIFKLLSRPFREGDNEEYEAARSAFLNEFDGAAAGYSLPHASAVLVHHKAKFGD